MPRVVIAGVPIGLILLQPDVGTMLVFVAITMGMLLVAGAKPRHIVALTIVGLVAIGGILNSDVLAEYQREDEWSAALQRAERSRPCERCGAQPGEPCRSATGKPADHHAARRHE